MSHSGPFRCQCGQIHADQYDGPSNDLLPYIDIDGVHALNESETGACRRVFKPYDQRLDQTAVVESEEDDPQIIIHIPFVSPVKIRALKLIGGGNGTAPRILRAYINREALDFTDVEDAPPVQQWDLAEDADSITLIENAIGTGKPVAAVCHAPAVLRHVKDFTGEPLVRGKRVTGFSNTEEAAVGLTDVVPFSVEDMLLGNGGDYRRAEDWNSHVEHDGLLITGQNPASSEATAEALLAALRD
jgi:hypothetical protein